MSFLLYFSSLEPSIHCTYCVKMPILRTFYEWSNSIRRHRASSCLKCEKMRCLCFQIICQCLPIESRLTAAACVFPDAFRLSHIRLRLWRPQLISTCTNTITHHELAACVPRGVLLLFNLQTTQASSTAPWSAIAAYLWGIIQFA